MSISYDVYEKFFLFINLIALFVGSVTKSDDIAPLYFLEFVNDERVYLALLDSGVQVNLVDERLLAVLRHEVVGEGSRIRQIQNADGGQVRIVKWIDYVAHFPDGKPIVVRAAVLPRLPVSILLGMPFLSESQAVVNYKSGIMRFSGGIIILKRKTEIPSAPVVAMGSAGKELNLGEHGLNEGQVASVKELLTEYEVLWEGNRIGRAKHHEHVIELTSEIPIVEKPRRYSSEENQEVERQVASMLKDEAIRPSNSPYSTELLLTPKYDFNGKFTSWRLCVDYRKLNQITILDQYPLPRISELVHEIRGSRYFCALDLKSGYWQVPMKKESIKYTAFRCISGFFEWIVMPFGLTNAPATFQRMIDGLFRDLRYKGVLAYLDDVLVHDATFEGCLAKLKVVFDRLAFEGLTLNMGKSRFFPKTLVYLGHIVEEGKIRPNPERAEPLDKMRTPTNVHEVRRALGMLGYYQIYIEGYAELVEPIYALLRGTINKKANLKQLVQWTGQCEAAFREGIRRLKKSMLTLPLEGDGFLLQTDASDIAIAGGLFVRHREEGNQWQPVEFVSKSLSAVERRWAVREREAFAIVFSIRKFDAYLRGRNFVVETDHESLRWMMEAKEGKIMRWAARLSEYSFAVRHRSGNQMENIDYLTRFLDHSANFDVEEKMFYPQNPSVNISFATEDNLPWIEQIVKEQQNAGYNYKAKGFQLKEGIVYYHSKIWVPPKYRMQVIHACHSVMPFRHMGIKKTGKTITRVFNWPRLHQDVCEFLRGCLYCQQRRPGHEGLQGLFRTHPLDAPFNTVYMDLYSCNFRGRSYTLTMIDSLTKWVECVPLSDKSSATIAKDFLCEWVVRHGVPRVIMSDNDPSFTSAVIEQMCGYLGATHLTSTRYHPEGNALIESFHRTLAKGLGSFIHPGGEKIEFKEALALVLYSYRASIHLTTGESPAFLTYGRDLKPARGGDWRFGPKQWDEGVRVQFLNELRSRFSIKYIGIG